MKKSIYINWIYLWSWICVNSVRLTIWMSFRQLMFFFMFDSFLWVWQWNWTKTGLFKSSSLIQVSYLRECTLLLMRISSFNNFIIYCMNIQCCVCHATSCTTVLSCNCPRLTRKTFLSRQHSLPFHNHKCFLFFFAFSSEMAYIITEYTELQFERSSWDNPLSWTSCLLFKTLTLTSLQFLHGKE